MGITAGCVSSQFIYNNCFLIYLQNKSLAVMNPVGTVYCTGGGFNRCNIGTRNRYPAVNGQFIILPLFNFATGGFCSHSNNSITAITAAATFTKGHGFDDVRTAETG